MHEIAAPPARDIASDADVLELVADAHQRSGKRSRRDLYDNCALTYKVLRQWFHHGRARGDGAPAAGDWHRMTFPQLQAAFYGEALDGLDAADAAALADGRARRRCLANWLNWLQDVGLIEWRSQSGRRAGGWYGGIEFRFLAVPELHSEAARGYSSVGVAAASCGMRRRRESRREREERRIAPWRRRGGRRGVSRYVAGREPPPPPRNLFFGRSDHSPLEPVPYGARQRGQTRAHESAAPAWLREIGVSEPLPGLMKEWRDAIERACHPARRAALRALRTASLSEEGLGVVRRAGGAGAPIDVVVLAAWSVAFPGLEPRFSIAKRQQLERSAAQYDRLCGRVGAAAELLVDEIAAADVDAAQGFDIRTVAFYVASLKAQSRWLRRGRRGAPPPRPHRSRGRA